MTARLAFLCYVHADDEADNGRILQLATDIEREYAALSSEPFSVVFDREHLSWGDDWQSRLTDAVGEASFLIPIITPRFFTSVECRRELEHFQKTAEALSRGQLVLPIIYIPVPDLLTDNADPARKLVARLQYQDWIELRFEERTSGAYRRAVNRLAVEVQARLISLPDPEPAPSGLLIDTREESDDDRPGMMDIVAENEGSLDSMTLAIASIGELTLDIGRLMSDSTEKLKTSNDQKATMANRIVIAGQLARDLAPVVDDFESEVQRFREAVDSADQLVEVFLQAGEFPENRETAVELAKVLVENAVKFRETFAQSDSFIDSMRTIENFTRALRPPVQRLRRALQSLRDTEPTIIAWGDDASDFLRRSSSLS